MISSHLYHHRRYFALFVLVILAVGLTSFRSIPRQEDPTITNFSASIITPFPGATPDRVEALVSRPIEDELLKMPEIDRVISTSSANISFIQVILEETLTDEEIERTWSELRDALGDARTVMPPGVGNTIFDNDRLASYSAIVAFRSEGDEDMPISLLHRLAQDFADLARNQSGTKQVDMFGEPVEEIRVEVDEAALVSRGLTLNQVALALAAADPKIASGRATTGGADLLIEVAGAFDSMERIRQVPIHTSASGSTTRITDIARVYKTQQSPPPTMALAQGREAILLGIAVQPGQRIDRWSAAFKKLLAEYEAQSPAGLRLELTYDQSTYTGQRLASVAQNLTVGVLLVIAVLLFTLGWRAAVVVAVVLPLCGLMSIAVLDRMGFALHQMSISGLIVALGLLVDGSIVMTDEIRKRLLRGMTPVDAITSSVHRLRIPLLSSAVTTILTFTPLVILPGPAGDFMGSIAIAVVIMLVSSLILALSFTPVLAAWLLPRRSDGPSPWYRGGAGSGKLGKQMVRAMDWSLRHPPAAIALALVLPISGFLAAPTLTAQFFPGTDRDQMFIQVKLADGRSIYDTLDLVKTLDDELRQEPLIRRVDWSLGESAPPFYYNMYRRRDGTPSWAEALVLTRDENQTDALIRRLQTELDRRYPHARIIVRGIDQGPPVDAPLEVEIYGPNLEVLNSLGEQFRARMSAIPQVTHTWAGITGGAPKLVFELDEDKLVLAGLQLRDAANALDAALRGRTGGEVLEGTERLPVRVRLGESEFDGTEKVLNIRVPLAARSADDGISAIPLAALGDHSLQVSQSPISRRDGERINVVAAQLERGVLPEEALKILQKDLSENPVTLPPGYRIVFGGDSEERAKVVEHIMAPMGLILSALFATIVLTFNSWRLSAIAFLVCVCSLGLSLLSLALFRYPIGVQALIGVIGSVGVSINAAIIIMTALQQDEAASKGGLFAIRQVVMDSSRHIISTTLTTFGGFLPLILEGSQFWPPFAMAIAGGVLLSTIVSFFLVPPMFALVTSKRRKPGQALADPPAQPPLQPAGKVAH